MEIADAELHRVDMEATLAIVDDVADWAAGRRGNLRGNPVSVAIVDQPSGAWAIIVRRSIDAPWVDSILARIGLNGKHDARTALSTPALFLRHLVLHELAHLATSLCVLAHLANNWPQEREDDCDDWALERLQDNVLRSR